jgi:glycosyltransferase involved in cell wall biosynthesis
VKILWLNWKDRGHPAAGGAEVVLWELSKRLVSEGHDVTLLTCGYAGAGAREVVDGVTIIRVGINRYIHSFQALLHYIRRLRNRFDLVIEVVNTAPYFSVFFGKKSRRMLFYHQLAREVWSHETKPPLSHFGRFIMEPLATRLLARANVSTITISESTRQDLSRFGFRSDRTHIIPQGMQFEPVKSLNNIIKFSRPTMLSLGTVRAMKRTKDQLAAFELAKKHLPELQFKIAGLVNDKYGEEVLNAIKNSPFAEDIEYLGRISDEEKRHLMQQSHIIVVTSVKEGWGLIVSEAASQGAPAVVYDVDGLRDSVRHRETGLVTATNPDALSKGVLALLSDSQTYKRLQRAAWEWSRELNFDNAYLSFKNVLERA